MQFSELAASYSIGIPGRLTQIPELQDGAIGLTALHQRSGSTVSTLTLSRPSIEAVHPFWHDY